jgi:hypothetical protein
MKFEKYINYLAPGSSQGHFLWADCSPGLWFGRSFAIPTTKWSILLQGGANNAGSP